MFPNSIAAFGEKDEISRDQYAADTQARTRNINLMLQMLRAKSYNIDPQAIPTGVATPLTFDTELIIRTQPFLHEPTIAPTHFTAQADGLYVAVGEIGLPAYAGTILSIFVRVNGVLAAAGNARQQVIPSGANGNRIQVYNLIQMAYLDYVEFLVFHDAPGALNTDVATTWGSLLLASRL